jgi:hypothetical protein
MTAEKQIDELSADHAGTHTPKAQSHPARHTPTVYTQLMTCKPCFPMVESHVTRSIDFGFFPGCLSCPCLRMAHGEAFGSAWSKHRSIRIQRLLFFEGFDGTWRSCMG